MKRLFLAMMLLSATLGFGQTDSLNVSITQAERIIDKYTGEITNAFEKGLERITPVAEQGFEIATKLQFSKGIAYLLLLPSTLMLGFLFIKYYKIAKDSSDYDWTDGDYGTPAVVLLIFSCIGLIGSIFATYHGLTHVIAPEWFAIKEIIRMFGGH